MEKTSQGKDRGAIVDQSFAGPLSDSEEVLAVETIQMLPDILKKEIIKRLPMEETMQLSRAHYTEAIAVSKKLKLSHNSGDDLLELNVPTQVPSTAIGESEQLVSGWTCLRMLIPTAQGDDVVGFDQALIESISEATKAKICIYHKDGVRVVMVSAEEDPSSSKSPALEAFFMAQMIFLDTETYFPPSAAFRLTRLLVPAAQARALIHGSTFKTIAEKADIISILSVGDVIVELQGLPERIIWAAREIASYFRQFPVEENKISELERALDSTHGASPPNSEASSWKFPQVKAQRSYEVQRFKGIPLSYVEDIIGDEGVNIARIQELTRATIFVAPGSKSDDARFHIFGDGRTDVEEARKVLASIIDKKGFFENANENIFVLPSSPGKGADSPPYVSSDEEGDDTRKWW